MVHISRMHRIRKQEVHNDVYLCGNIVTISTTRALKNDFVEEGKKEDNVDPLPKRN